MALTTDEPTPGDAPSDPGPTPLDIDSLESLVKARQTRRDGWTLLIWAFAAVALFASAVAIGFAMRAIDESKQNVAGGAAAGTATQVSLTEFSISPVMITASQAGGLDIVNSGTVEHNLAVQGTEVKTAMIPAGGSAASRPLGPRSGRLHGLLRSRGSPGVGHAGDAAPRRGERDGFGRHG